MSLAKVNLAVIMRQAQIQDNKEAINTLNELLTALHKDGLASYFSLGSLSQVEVLFMQDFFDFLIENVGSTQNFIPFSPLYLMHLQDIKRAKELTKTFDIHLIEVGSGMFYLSWCKGIFDKE